MADPYAQFEKDDDPYSQFESDAATPWDEDAGGQLVRGINRGIHSLAALPGEIVGGAVGLAGFPETADKLRLKNNPISDFMTSPDVQPQTGVGRFANAIGQAAGASAIPTAGLVGNASRLSRLAPTTAPRAILQDIGTRVAANPAGAISADLAASTGGAIGSQTARESGGGPIIQTLAGMAGAMTPGAIAGAGRSVARPIAKARAMQGEQGAYGSVAESIEGGPAALRRSIAAGGGTETVAKDNALRILGEEMVSANGNVQLANQNAIARIAREGNVTPDTAANQLRDIRQAHQNNPLMLGEQPSVSDNALRGPGGGMRQAENVNLDQLKNVQDSATRAKFDYLASSGNAKSAVDTRQALQNRQQGLADNLRGAFARIQQTADSQGRSLDIQDSENLIEQASRAGSRAYEHAYNSPINNQVMMQTLPRVLQRFERQAAGRAGDVADAMNNAARQFYSNTPDGPIALMSLRQLQDARTRVREMRDAFRDAGQNSLARPVNHLYNQVTALMTRMSPEWAVANRQWADMHLDTIGRDLGDAFSKTPGPGYRRQLRQFEQLNPQAQDVVRVHYIQKLLDNIERGKDVNAIGKQFETPHNRSAIRSILGNEAAVDFTRAVRNISAAEKTFNQNSRTHIRGEVKNQEQQYTNLEAARRSWSLQSLKDLLIEKAGQVLTERKDQPMSRIVTTPVSNTPAVAMHLERMRGAQARLRSLAQPRIRPNPGMGLFSPQLYSENE